MHKYIKSNELKTEDFPDIEIMGWDEITTFALTFNPEIELGTSGIYEMSNTKFDEHSTIQELRRCLFLKQRWWNNRLTNIDQSGLREMREIIRLIKLKI